MTATQSHATAGSPAVASSAGPSGHNAAGDDPRPIAPHAGAGHLSYPDGTNELTEDIRCEACGDEEGPGRRALGLVGCIRCWASGAMTDGFEEAPWTPLMAWMREQAAHLLDIEPGMFAFAIGLPMTVETGRDIDAPPAQRANSYTDAHEPWPEGVCDALRAASYSSEALAAGAGRWDIARRVAETAPDPAGTFWRARNADRDARRALRTQPAQRVRP